MLPLLPARAMVLPSWSVSRFSTPLLVVRASILLTPSPVKRFAVADPPWISRTTFEGVIRKRCFDCSGDGCELVAGVPFVFGGAVGGEVTVGVVAEFFAGAFRLLVVAVVGRGAESFGQVGAGVAAPDGF